MFIKRIKRRRPWRGISKALYEKEVVAYFPALAVRWRRGIVILILSTKKRSSSDESDELLCMKKKAASYSPALLCSTIGAGGLNFSVRDGKRWDTAAITT